MSEPERWAAIAILSFCWLSWVRVAWGFAADAFSPKSPLLPTHIAERIGVLGGFLALAVYVWWLWLGAPGVPFDQKLAPLGLLAWVIIANYGLLAWAVGCGVTYQCCFRGLVWVWRRRVCGNKI
jgi:hypothetical protein